MSPSLPNNILDAFGPEQAATYDERFSKLSAINSLLHLVIQSQFAHLPDNAHILIAGAGTGADVRHLAPLFPSWHFTLADPADAMLEIAWQHANQEGFADRCTFHAGYVSSLPETQFDAATSLLVSHFLNEEEDRTAYYRSIAERLQPSAPLFEAALCGNRYDTIFETEMEVWLGLMNLAGMTDEGGQNYRQSFGTLFATHDPSEVEKMIGAAKFGRPVQCFQAGLIRGWITHRL
ncbi:class I SAM-dependent methyltransferase [Hyphomonas pacifica]|uniref:class I SAM-dependent methyltransferase n=1 Tax=Hyphomonas pacifica TaxID=1280941 RepID=UPI0004A1A6C4|nr:class I SAM-dependent methyltransferase [Hyphomonas pacifica]KCZ53018.1 hypothetical protein HY2_00405 [Hyphomonas pacifica]RAN37863.1 hypothetical protein HY11_08230 [Hyphomonas pacifica]